MLNQEQVGKIFNDGMLVLNIEGKSTDSRQVIANAFNNYFLSVAEKINNIHINSSADEPLCNSDNIVDKNDHSLTHSLWLLKP